MASDFVVGSFLAVPRGCRRPRRMSRLRVSRHIAQAPGRRQDLQDVTRAAIRRPGAYPPRQDPGSPARTTPGTAQKGRAVSRGYGTPARSQISAPGRTTRQPGIIGRVDVEPGIGSLSLESFRQTRVTMSGHWWICWIASPGSSQVAKQSGEWVL